MAQHSNEHLTIAELSAYIDKELTPEELALCDAHIQTCQPCQAALADLRLTSALLSSMPQVAVPRSFVLPTNLLLLPETPAITTTKTATRVSTLAPSIWRRSMRTASTLVAILGLLFCLAGALSTLSHSETNTSTASTTSGLAVPHAATVQATPTPTQLVVNTPPQRLSPDTRATYQAATAAAMRTPPPTPTSTHATYNGIHQDQPPAQQPGLPAALDLGQAAGRLTIGAVLLLGILGAIVTRLFDRASERHP